MLISVKATCPSCGAKIRKYSDQVQTELSFEDDEEAKLVMTFFCSQKQGCMEKFRVYVACIGPVVGREGG